MLRCFILALLCPCLLLLPCATTLAQEALHQDKLASRIFQNDPPAGWKQGILDPTGEPYPLLLNAIPTTNREVLERLYHLQ